MTGYYLPASISILQLQIIRNWLCSASRWRCQMAVDSVDSARVEQGWNRPRGTPSLSEVFGSITTRPSGSFWRKLLTFLGPGYLVAVGYMDPGNWATSLAGGSKFG